MRLKESINQNQINLLKATYGDIKKINPNSAAVKKLMMVLKKLSKNDLETISKAKINFVSTMAQSILRDSNVSESAEMDNLQKRKNDLLKQVDPLIAKKKKLYSDVDITTPKSSDEKKLDKEIADLFSEINDLVHKIVKLKKSQNEGRNTMKLKSAVTEEIAVGKMVKVVNNPHWEAALGKKGPFKRKVKMIDGDNVFFTDGSNSSMKYVKEDIQPTNEAASRTAMEIGGLTGLNKDAVQKFVDTHNMDIEAVYQYIKKSKITDRLNFVTAVVGNPGNPFQKRMIKMFAESINEVDAMLNKKVYKLLMKELGDLRTGGPNHQFAVMHILIGALRDANFYSDAKKVPALFPKAEYEGDPMGKEDTIDIYEYDLGPKIANMAQWDGGAIADAIAFYTSMTIGRPLGQKIEKLIASMSSKYDLKESIKESVNEASYTVKAENPYQFVNGVYAVLNAYLRDEELGPKAKKELQTILKSLDYMRKYFYSNIKESAKKFIFTKVARISNNGKLDIY